MDTRPVAVIDSGIGGLPYLAWLQEHLPLETFVYVADRKNFPYGGKTPDEVRHAVGELCRGLVEKYDPKILVVACNTASVLALEHLRGIFDGPVVGVVPAVKTAAAVTKNGKIGVLATQRTIDGGYLDRLIAEFCPGKDVHGWAASDIVTFVEDDFLAPNQGERDRILGGWAAVVADTGVDTVVLGCTHFLHVTDDLSRRLGPGVVLLDSRDGVGRQVTRLLTESHRLSQGPAQPSVLFFTADPQWPKPELDEHERKYRHFANVFGLGYGGPWGDCP